MYPTQTHPIPPNPLLPYPSYSTLTLPYPTLPYPTLPYPTLPYPTLPYPYPTAPHPTAPYPTLPYPTLPYPLRIQTHAHNQTSRSQAVMRQLLLHSLKVFFLWRKATLYKPSIPSFYTICACVLKPKIHCLRMSIFFEHWTVCYDALLSCT